MTTKKKPVARRRSVGRQSTAHLFSAGLPQDRALIVLRKGNAIDQARILNKEFVIDIEELGKLKVPTKLIKTVILKNLPLFPLDSIRLLKGNVMNGTVLTDPIRADSEEASGRIDIPLSKILSIVF